MRKGINLEQVFTARNSLIADGIRPTFKSVHARIKEQTGISTSQGTLSKYMKLLKQTDPHEVIEDPNLLGQLEQLLRKTSNINPELVRLNERVTRLETTMAKILSQLNKEN